MFLPYQRTKPLVLVVAPLLGALACSDEPRVTPLVPVDADHGVVDDVGIPPKPDARSSAGPDEAPDDTLCTNTCPYANDGDCDDGGPGSSFSLCDLGTDCNDCGPRRPDRVTDADAGFDSDVTDDTRSDTHPDSTPPPPPCALVPSAVCDGPVVVAQDACGVITRTPCATSERCEAGACRAASEPARENCTDGLDNTGNGLVDCDDPQCATSSACAGDTCGRCLPPRVCVGGACLDPIDPYDYVPATAWSYVSSIQIADESCCFDYNGDGRPDNGFYAAMGVLRALAGDVDFDETLEEAIVDDDVTLLVEYREWPGQGRSGLARLSFWDGTNDLNGNGDPDQRYDGVRASGDGTFRVKLRSFGMAGAYTQFNNARYDGLRVSAGPSSFRLTLPTGDTIPGLTEFHMDLESARIEGPLSAADFRFSSNDRFGAGGIRLGGVLSLNSIFAFVDQGLRACTCAGINPSRPVLSYGEVGSFYTAECAQTFSAGSCVGQGVLCENVGLVCQLAPSLVDFVAPDVDLSGSGVNDAFSVGMWLSFVSARVQFDWFE